METTDGVIVHENLIEQEFIYRDGFKFQRMNKDYLWYVIYKNQLINCSQYRTDLKEWVDSNYYKNDELIYKIPDINQLKDCSTCQFDYLGKTIFPCADCLTNTPKFRNWKKWKYNAE